MPGEREKGRVLQAATEPNGWYYYYIEGPANMAGRRIFELCRVQCAGIYVTMTHVRGVKATSPGRRARNVQSDGRDCWAALYT